MTTRNHEFFLCGFSPRAVFTSDEIDVNIGEKVENEEIVTPWVHRYNDPSEYPEKAIRIYKREIGELCDDVFSEEKVVRTRKND